MKKNKGSSLIITFIFVTLAGLLSVYAYHYSSQSLLAKSEYLKTSNANERDVKAVFEKYIKQQPSSESILDCFKENKELCIRTNRHFGEVANHVNITGILLDNPAKFPIFDMEKLFSIPKPCSKKIKHSGESSVNGTGLTKHSSISKETCLYISPETHDEIRSFENIFSDFDLNLTGKFLVSGGYIQSLGRITIDKDFLIFAAGDINLNKITVLNYVHLTIVSTTGLINIAELEGSPKLKTISRLGTFINGNTLPQDLIQVLPYLKNLIISYDN